MEERHGPGPELHHVRRGPLLERYFGDLVDYGFTAAMEDDLDDIANGRGEALPWLTRFYFGVDDVVAAPNGHGGLTSVPGPDGDIGANGTAVLDGGDTGRLGFKAAVATHLGEIDAQEINSIPLGTGSTGEEIVVRVGRYGPYLQRGEDRASIPGGPRARRVDHRTGRGADRPPSNDRVLGDDPDTGLPVQVRAGRFGPYVQLGEAGEGNARPRTASLFAA